MLVELANETVVATQQIVVRFGFRSRIRKRGTGDVRRREASMRVCCFNRCPIDNEAEQQKRQRASKHAMLLW
jgi:hypothetical protein